MERDQIFTVAAAALSGLAGAVGAIGALTALRRSSTSLGSCREQLSTLGHLRLAAVRDLVEKLEDDTKHDFESLAIVSLLDLPAAAAGAFSDEEWEESVWSLAQEDAVSPAEVIAVMKRHGLGVGAVIPLSETPKSR
ncbi:MAG: hypothetical protein KC468_22320 [Myxococcales bacterium]|nr:hypothetical protein [Myxococcales bacterium]